MMTDELIRRYQYGGDLFTAYASQYGHGAAENIAAAARTGDRFKVGEAIQAAKYGSKLNDSTFSIFTNQIVTDPLAAPLESAEKIAGNTILAFLKNPIVTLILVVGLALWLVGPKELRKLIGL